MNRPMPKVVIAVLVALHLGATLWHGHAHTVLDVRLPLVKTAFVVVVIIVAPLVAASLMWTRHALAGVWLFFVSMLGALLFGVYHHYVLASPDNVGQLPHGSAEAASSFISSAAVLAVLELTSTIYGAFCLGKGRA